MKTGAFFFSIFLLLSQGAVAGQAFTYEDLVSVIKQKNLRSVEEVLPYFPENMRSNFTLVRASESLQVSDDQHPRVILFGDDAQLTCTFGGSPVLTGYDTLECYQFRASERRFDFREIVFPTSENGIKEPEFSESNRQASGPFQCSDCHSSDPRPNWEPYNIWKGAYGSQDDTFQAVLEKSVKSTAQEKEAFLKFKSHYQESPRYSQLIFAPTRFAPYSEETSGDTRTSPNFRLTYHVTQLTAQRNVRLLEEQPLSIRRQFLQFVAGCAWSVQKNPLKGLITLARWTPAFRSLDPRCSDCLPEDYANSTLVVYGYNTGKGYLNETVAYHLITDMVRDGELPAEVLNNSVTDSAYDIGYEGLGTPVAPSIEPYKLRHYCSLLGQKNSGQSFLVPDIH